MTIGQEEPAIDGRRGPGRVAAAGVGGALGFAFAVFVWSAPGSLAGEVPPPHPITRSMTVAGDSYADLVEKVTPAVVTVWSERRARTTGVPFGESFGAPSRQAPREPRGRQQRGLGSGVVVTDDGYVLTNHHVVDGAESITVELVDRRRFEATVVGVDPPSDLAVLKVEADALSTLDFGSSEAVRVGDVVLAVGNPLGVGQTVTMGIISAKGRATGAGNGSFEDFLQTDAPINQGNSGGALVNTSGELVGINTQILSPSGGNIGIGFAIPADMARGVMAQLIAGGEVRRGMLGVTVQAVTAEIAESLGLFEVQGALVNEVRPEGPAGRAGVQRGDLITGIDGHTVRDGNDLRNRVSQARPGTTVDLSIRRDDRTDVVSITLGRLPGPRTAAARFEDPQREATLGMSVRPLTPELARSLDLPDDHDGLLVAEVRPGSAAENAGIRPGDVLAEANRQPIRTVEDLGSALEASGDRPALVLLERGGGSLYVTLRREARG